MANKATAIGRYLLLVLLGVLFIAGTNQSFGQDTNASLGGTVTDPSGAVIPGAKLTLTNQATSFQSTYVSDAAGEYNFHNLTPGKYTLAVTATGFKSTTQTGIELAVNQTGRVDVHMEVGKTDETVTVTGDASLINYENQTLEGGVSPETLQSFPLTVNGAPRSSVAVAIMMPGVTTAGSGNAFNARINGGIVTGDEAVVDGATAIEGFMNQSGMVSLQTDFGMSPDITSEVKVLTANYDAQYGDTTSGQLIIETKGGTEQFHGAGYEYIRNDAFNAIVWGVDPGTKKPGDKENDFGANIGGPILLPKLHGNSWAKGYFYFNWEGFQDHGSSTSSTLSIASLNARQGDFSAITSQLYYPNDPAKYGADAGQPIAFGGQKNVINQAYADPIAANFMSFLPQPTNGDESNNYFVPHSGQGSLTNSENVYFWRTDFNLGNKDHLYYTYWWQYAGVNTQSDLPLALSTASPANPENAPIQRLNWEHTFSPVMTNHLTLGYLNRNEGYYALNGKADLSRVPGVADASFNPQMNIGGYSQLGNSGVPNSSLDKTTRGTYALNEVLTRVMGKHTLKGGFEWRLAGTAIHLGGNQGGTFTFNADTTGNVSCPKENPCPGDGMASFYLGAVGNANVSFYNVKAEYPRQYAYAAHAGDSWRITPKFTLNYSLRWDYIAPFKEKFDNLSFLDPKGGNPGAVTSSGTELAGRLAFAGHKWGAASYGADFPEKPFKTAWAPRLGFAYTLNEKTVVRAGYGIYYGQAFYPGWDGGMSLEGFNKTVNINELQSGINAVPVIYLNSGLTQGQIGQTQNIASDFENGQTPAKYRPLDGNRRPYSQQWNVTVERQLPNNFFAQVSYVGTKGTHLPSAMNPLNIIDPLDPGIAAIGADLQTDYNTPNGPAIFASYGVNQPYVGWASQIADGSSCSATIAQALVPYPQYCGNISGQNEQHATSQYESLQARVERHLTNGLYALGSLTIARLYTDASDTTQSTNDTFAGNQGNNGQFSPFHLFPRAWALAPDNVPVTGQIAVVYDLPFGHTKRWLNSGGISNYLIGGWQVSPLWRYEYGTPFSFYASQCPTNQKVPQFREGCVPGILSGAKVQPHGRNGFNPANGNTYFNIDAFETDFSTIGYTGTGKAVTSVYGPSFKDLDISFTKNTRIAEKVNFRFESNFFNAFNNHYFLATQGGNYSGPSVAFATDVSNGGGTQFGTWTHSVTPPRTIQFAGRIEF